MMMPKSDRKRSEQLQYLNSFDKVYFIKLQVLYNLGVVET